MALISQSVGLLFLVTFILSLRVTAAEDLKVIECSSDSFDTRVIYGAPLAEGMALVELKPARYERWSNGTPTFSERFHNAGKYVKTGEVERGDYYFISTTKDGKMALSSKKSVRDSNVVYYVHGSESEANFEREVVFTRRFMNCSEPKRP